MAIMIPSAISPEIKSNAEKHVFEWFKNAPGTEDWIVLHSLGIVNHRKVIYGETDFFVLAPGMGLFALEVKGGRVKREGGNWFFTDKYGKTSSKNRGPFEQAWDGVFSITGDIKSKVDTNHKHIKRAFFGIGVMFPDIKYDTVGCDEAQWQVFDVDDGNNVRDYIVRLFEGAKERWIQTRGREITADRLPSKQDVQYIASLLRGDFDKAVAISAKIRYSEEELIRLTDQQYRCIDQLDDNKRCLITGGAGTGKTLVALEETKKAAAAGLSVALFCFNKNLGEWFEHYFKDMPEELRPSYCGTLHSFMLRILKNSGVEVTFPKNEADSNEFYRESIPNKIIANDISIGDRFDKIIIDEAQDLINPNYLNVFDIILNKGLSRGVWTMFGDFSRQAIYSNNQGGGELIEQLEERTSFIRFKLTVNCRNTKTICDEITLVTGFEPPSDVWSKVEGVPVEYITYSDEEEQAAKLSGLLASLAENNITPDRVTILSPLKKENSVIGSIESDIISDYKLPMKSGKIAFSTIQAYKGLENVIIILVDIDSVSDNQLMYVALSRARSALYVLESDNARNEYIEMQLRRLSRG